MRALLNSRITSFERAGFKRCLQQPWRRNLTVLPLAKKAIGPKKTVSRNKSSGGGRPVLARLKAMLTGVSRWMYRKCIKRK